MSESTSQPQSTTLRFEIKAKELATHWTYVTAQVPRDISEEEIEQLTKLDFRTVTRQFQWLDSQSDGIEITNIEWSRLAYGEPHVTFVRQTDGSLTPVEACA